MSSGHDFLDALYRSLASDARIETVTMSEAVAGVQGPPVPRIHSGSWIEASYRIWIGHREDRLAWTALGRAREAVEAARVAGAPADKVEHALRHLRAAEGSDWYWWYGEDFSTENAAEFDALFRGHVLRACELLDLAPPQEALQPIKPTGRGALEAKALREPTALLRPVIDGREPDFFEWQGAGVHRPGRGRGSMFGGAPTFSALFWGFDEANLFLRLDPDADPDAAHADRIRVTLLGPLGPSRLEFPVAARRGLPPGPARPRGGGACRAAQDPGGGDPPRAARHPRGRRAGDVGGGPLRRRRAGANPPFRIPPALRAGRRLRAHPLARVIGRDFDKVTPP